MGLMKKLITALVASIALFIVVAPETPAQAQVEKPNASYWTSTCCLYNGGSCTMDVVTQDGVRCWCNDGFFTYRGLTC